LFHGVALFHSLDNLRACALFSSKDRSRQRRVTWLLAQLIKYVGFPQKKD
jgi:hypothetical protein